MLKRLRKTHTSQLKVFNTTSNRGLPLAMKEAHCLFVSWLHVTGKWKWPCNCTLHKQKEIFARVNARRSDLKIAQYSFLLNRFQFMINTNKQYNDLSIVIWRQFKSVHTKVNPNNNNKNPKQQATLRQPLLVSLFNFDFVLVLLLTFVLPSKTVFIRMTTLWMHTTFTASCFAVSFASKWCITVNLFIKSTIKQ